MNINFGQSKSFDGARICLGIYLLRYSNVFSGIEVRPAEPFWTSVEKNSACILYQSLEIPTKVWS